MILAPFNDSDIHQFCTLLPIFPTQNFKGLKGIVDGRVVIGTGWDCWTKNSVETHIWVENPRYMTRQFLREVFTHLFVTCNLGIVIGVTLCNNGPALELNRRLGFTEICRIKDGYDLGTDSAIQVMRRENCRWIAEDYRCPKVALHQLQTTSAPLMLKASSLRH